MISDRDQAQERTNKLYRLFCGKEDPRSSFTTAKTTREINLIDVTFNKIASNLSLDKFSLKFELAFCTTLKVIDHNLWGRWDIPIRNKK